MSFYSYKNANAQCSPGCICTSALDGLNQRICIQVKNVYDSCMQQEQLDDVVITVSDIVPVLPDKSCHETNTRPCSCSCAGNACSCSCNACGAPLSYSEAVENAENANCPLPQPCGQWTFESCRSSTTEGTISNLTIDRLCDRPQFARVKGTVSIPIDVLFTDQRCQEWIGRGTVSVVKDVLLAIPDESIVPFTLESLVSAICVSGTYIGNCQFEITICVTIVLKILAEVELMVPSYGYCEIPPCEEFAENVCDEFFSLPLFPQQSASFQQICNCSNGTAAGMTATSTATTASANCGCVNNLGCQQVCSTCCNCGTTCAGCSSSLCPRCGGTMTSSTSA